jgi:hypothetical protein
MGAFMYRAPGDGETTVKPEHQENISLSVVRYSVTDLLQVVVQTRAQVCPFPTPDETQRLGETPS